MATSVQHPLNPGLEGSRQRVLWALLVATLLHLATLVLLPERLLPAHRVSESREAVIYDLTLIDPATLRFVEANPEAPENEPDRKDQYSFRAQQAADENPLSTADNAPRVEGETDSQKILEGQLEQAPPVPPGVYSPQALPGEGNGPDGGTPGETAQATPLPVPPMPPPDFIRQKPVSEAGPGSRVEQTALAPKEVAQPTPDAPIPVYRPSTESEPSVEGDGSGGAVEARPAPRPRPRLAPELLSGPLMQSNSSANRRGALAIDATFSEFGEYEQQFYAVVQTAWYQEIEFFRPIDTGTRVHVRFRMRADGSVDQLETVDTTASKIASLICETAITKRSPFRPWSKEMVEVFGRERWINIVFHYR